MHLENSVMTSIIFSINKVHVFNMFYKYLKKISYTLFEYRVVMPVNHHASHGVQCNGIDSSKMYNEHFNEVWVSDVHENTNCLLNPLTAVSRGQCRIKGCWGP